METHAAGRRPHPRTNLVDSLAHRMDLPDRQAVAALDQMSWHVFCCYYLLAGFNNEIKDALGAAVEPEFLREMGSRIAELRTDVETALAEISVRHFGSMCCSSAESFQEELDATSDPQSILYPNADFAPQCQKVGERAYAAAPATFFTSVAANGLKAASPRLQR